MTTRAAAFLLALLFSLSAAFAADTPAPSAAPEATPSLHFRQGRITLENGLAEINVPDDFRFLDAADAKTVVTDIWGNPPDAAEGILGMLLPAAAIDNPDADKAWGVVITYEDSGYVKDNDANKINYNDLLKQMQKSAREHNAERIKAGYPTLDIVGWAAPPRYDAAAKKLYWAKELKSGSRTEHSLNYDVRILGRRGVLNLSAVAGMDQLEEIKAATPAILSMVNYNQGHRYADFNPKTDKVAAYGLAALVVGGIAAKAGFFKLLIPVLLAAKKFVVIGVVALAALVKRIFGRGERQS